MCRVGRSSYSPSCPMSVITSFHHGGITMSIPSGCLPFARVLGADWHVIREAQQAPIPRLLLGVVCECLCGLPTLKPHDRAELVRGLDIPEQFPREVARGP